jgi:hypothetical protein
VLGCVEEIAETAPPRCTVMASHGGKHLRFNGLFLIQLALIYIVTNHCYVIHAVILRSHNAISIFH